MKQAKHSPGPWTLADGYIIADADGSDVAQWYASESTEEQDLANARLIAAAPDLMDACLAALSQLTEDRAEYLEQDIAQLRAAVAKATGGAE